MEAPFPTGYIHAEGATMPKAMRGFRTFCPLCGAEDVLHVYLDQADILSCQECECEIRIDELRERIETWTAIIDWLGKAPPLNP